MKLFFWLGIFCWGALSHAAETPPKFSLVENFFRMQNRVHLQNDFDHCRPDMKSCVDAACAKLGNFGCDQNDEVNRVVQACRSNYNGDCLKAACGWLGNFGCDEESEVLAVARACKGNYGGACVNSSCQRLGTFGCDSLSEVTAIASSCSEFY